MPKRWPTNGANPYPIQPIKTERMEEEIDLHYFKFCFQRFNNSTMGWKDDEVGAYVRLLIRQFDKGFIPDDPGELSRLATSFKKTWPLVGKKFKKTEIAGQLKNGFMEIVRAEAVELIEKNTSNGKKGGRPKKNRPVIKTETETKPVGLPNESDTHNGLLVNGSDVLKSKEGVRQPIVQAMTDIWKELKPDYPFDVLTDGGALFEIGEFLAGPLKIRWIPEAGDDYQKALEAWKALAKWVVADDFYKSFSLAYMAKTKTLQTIWQKSKEVKNGTAVSKTGSRNGKQAGADELAGILAAKLTGRGTADVGG